MSVRNKTSISINDFESEMSERRPIAFLSYVRSDDDHDSGQITAFRKRLEGEVRMQTGTPFEIFQDRNDISWGQHWEEQIDRSLSDAAFLIPIITPSFFRSPACRSEFQTFSLKEKTLGANKLILPLYYVACDQLGNEYKNGSDEIVDVLRGRNWTDWRPYRFKQFTDEEVASALAKMATMIKSSIRELDAINAASKQKEEMVDSVLEIALETTDLSAKLSRPKESAQDIFAYNIPEVRPTLDKKQKTIVAPESYYAYTKAFDEIIDASDLASAAEQMALYRHLSKRSSQLKNEHAEALLAKLANFQLKDHLDSKLAISILIDNSGSMRGLPITYTAAWCLIMVEWLERLGIPTEVLGFTTRAWKGGQSRDAWLADEKPSSPGRLNDLRHLIYKPFSATADVSAPNFGVMMRDGLLKENIDGEAVLWASSRLSSHPAENKILFVLSDGAPVDDSTLSLNPGNYLEKHLRSVIKEVSEKITVYAIGIGHDVSRYYPNTAVATDSEKLGFCFFDLLVENQVFKETWTKTA